MIRDNLQELPRFKDPRLTKVPSNLLISSIKDMEVYQCIPPLTLFLKDWISQPVFLIFHGDLSVVNLELQQLRVLLGSSNDPKTDSWIERSLTIPDVDKPSLIFPKALPINRDKSWFKSIRFMINPFDSPPTKKWGGSPSAAARRPEIWWTPFLTAPPSSPVVPPSAGNVPWSSGRRWPTGDQRRMWWRWMRCLAPKTMSWWIGGMDLVVVHYHYLYIYTVYRSNDINHIIDPFLKYETYWMWYKGVFFVAGCIVKSSKCNQPVCSIHHRGYASRWLDGCSVTWC